jgi:hypothetical protein
MFNDLPMISDHPDLPAPAYLIATKHLNEQIFLPGR